MVVIDLGGIHPKSPKKKSGLGIIRICPYNIYIYILYNIYIPWSSKAQAKEGSLGWSMDVQDSRSYQWAKFGPFFVHGDPSTCLPSRPLDFTDLAKMVRSWQNRLIQWMGAGSHGGLFENLPYWEGWDVENSSYIRKKHLGIIYTIEKQRMSPKQGPFQKGNESSSNH